MKRITYILILCLILISSIHAYSRKGEFLSIEKIDTRSHAPDVQLSVLVRGFKSINLDESNFSVHEDGVPAEKLFIKKDKEKNGFVFLIVSIDSSKSISSKSLGDIKQSAKNLVESALDTFKIGVCNFDDEVYFIQDSSSKREDLFKTIDAIVRHGSKTLLYNAIYDGIEKLAVEEGAGKGIVVFTDGKDEGSGMTIDDVVGLAKEKRIAVSFVTLKKGKDNSSIDRIAKRTGGIVYFIDEKNNGKKIIKQLENAGEDRYVIEYRGKDSDIKIRQLEVSFKNDDQRDRISTQIEYPSGLEKYSFSKYFLPGGLILLGVLILLSLYLFLRAFKTKNHPAEEAPVQKIIPPVIDDFLEDYSSRRIDTDEMSHNSRGWLLEKDGAETGKKFPIFWDSVTIGTNPSNGIVVHDKTVSLIHVRIRRIKKSFFIIDQASDNGTFLNGRKLLRVKKLSDWDEIRIGNTVFIFRTIKGRV
jgi:von Willebrand factor type A domain/FHA domain